MRALKAFWAEEDGIGVVEIILILVILVAVIVIFRKQIADMISTAFEQIEDGTTTITEDWDIKTGDD